MSDATDLLAQAGVSTVTAGVVAYLTTLWRTNGEIRKLRAERDETHYSHRQANYHNLLNAERHMHAILREQQRPPLGPPGWIDAKNRFRECVNGVIISGSDSTVEAARALDAIYFPRSSGDDPPARGAIDWTARDAAQRRFVEAVRTDLGAPGARRV